MPTDTAHWGWGGGGNAPSQSACPSPCAVGSVSPTSQMSKLTLGKSHLPKVTQLLSVYLHLRRERH